MASDDPAAPPAFIEPSAVLSHACRFTAWVPQTDATDEEQSAACEGEEEDGALEEQNLSAQQEHASNRFYERELVWVTVGLTKVCVCP